MRRLGQALGRNKMMSRKGTTRNVLLDSAEATLSVADVLRAFSIRTLVAAKDSDINKKIITDIVQGQKVLIFVH